MNPNVTVKNNSDFRRIYAKGKSAVTPLLVVYCSRNRNGKSRSGIAVSAKLGNAVTRNGIKRKFREIYRSNLSSISPGRDIVVVARSKAVDADYTALNSAFVSACSKLGIIQAAAE